MEPNQDPEEDKIVLNSYIQFGTYAITFLGTVIANHVQDHIKHKNFPPVEPAEA